MSDPTQAAKIGAKAAAEAAATSGTTASSGAEQGASSFGSAVSRARAKVAAAAASVQDQVGDTISSVREGAKDDSSEASEQVTPARAGAPAVARRTRKARLRLSRIDPWSVMKTMLLFSVAGAIIAVVSVWVVWGVINASGVFDSINSAVNKLVATPGAEESFDLKKYVSTYKVLGFTALVGAFNVVLLTALATIFSFLYNLAATVMGGLEVTLAED